MRNSDPRVVREWKEFVQAPTGQRVVQDLQRVCRTARHSRLSVGLRHSEGLFHDFCAIMMRQLSKRPGRQ